MTGQEAVEFPSGVGELKHSAALSQAAQRRRRRSSFTTRTEQTEVQKNASVLGSWQRKETGERAALARFPSHSS